MAKCSYCGSIMKKITEEEIQKVKEEAKKLALICQDPVFAKFQWKSKRNKEGIFTRFERPIGTDLDGSKIIGCFEYIFEYFFYEWGLSIIKINSPPKKKSLMIFLLKREIDYVDGILDACDTKVFEDVIELNKIVEKFCKTLERLPSLGRESITKVFEKTLDEEIKKILLK